MRAILRHRRRTDLAHDPGVARSEYAVHTALIGMLGFVAIREHHVLSDLLLWNVGIGSRPGTLTMSARPDLLFPALGHGSLLS